MKLFSPIVCFYIFYGEETKERTLVLRQAEKHAKVALTSHVEKHAKAALFMHVDLMTIT